MLSKIGEGAMTTILMIVPSNQRISIERGLRSEFEDIQIEFADTHSEVRERIGLHPVDVLVCPLHLVLTEDGSLIDQATEFGISVVVYGELADAFRLEQAVSNGASGQIIEQRLAADLPMLLSSVFEQRNAMTQQQIMREKIVMRTLKVEMGNDKNAINGIVQHLLDECESQGVIKEVDRMKVGVSLEEALVNAIVHGNLEVSSKLREGNDDEFEKLIELRQKQPEYADRSATIECSISQTEAIFTIQDDGPGFDVAAIPDPTDPEYIERPSGRGILLMRSFMDDVQYNETGNCVTLTKRVQQESAVVSEHELCSAG